MSSLVVLEQMVMIFILILTGFVLYKKKMISDSASKDLSALVVNVCSPGLIIVSMFNDLSQIPRENVIFVGIIGVIFYLFLIFFGYFLVWVLKVPEYLKKTVGGTCSRLLYIFKLVWETQPFLLIFMLFMTVYNGIMPLVGTWMEPGLEAESVGKAERRQTGIKDA